MRKLLSVTCLFLFHSLLFASSADTAIVEITDAAMPSVYYHKKSFAVPTKLVFKNLTSVSGYIYFHQNVNLVEVDFPLLKSCGQYFYFYQNAGLQSMVAPNLNTVGDYMVIYGNKALTQLQVCNLQRIVPTENNPEPSSIYYDISNNTASVDKTPQCFSNGGPGNLALSHDSISENVPVKSFIGKLSATSSANDELTYYITNEAGDNDAFMIRGDSLLSATIFNYASKSIYNITIGVLNQLGEKIRNAYSVKIKPSLVVQDTVVLEISDTSLSSLYYHKQLYEKPTKLVFKNLAYVGGDIYFHQNVNLVAVDLPKLKSCAGHFYFYQNVALQKIAAPLLNTIQDYLAVYGNTALMQLQVCNLQQILPGVSNPDPFSIYYDVSNNTPSVDKIPLCFSKGAPGNLTLSKDSVRENLPVGSFISKLSATANPDDKLGYYLSGDQTDNSQFVIHSDSLLSATTFDYESKKSYAINITVVNQLGEKMEKAYSININDVAVEDTVLYVITDSTLASISYHQYSFTTPTKLLYKNLKRVTDYVYFHQNVNLIEASFPLMDSIGGFFYFHENKSLQTVNAPALKTIGGYLYVNGNLALTQFNVCSLTSILPADFAPAPYYYFSNNTSLDYASTCLKKTSVIYVPVTDIIVMPAPNTVIGYFISDAGSTDSVRYYFIDGEGKETTHPDFVIRGDSLFLTKDFASYSDTSIAFDINAIRTGKGSKRPLGITQSLTEKISLTVRTNLTQSVRYSTQWIGLCTTPATSAWENAANWSTNIVPDANMDVTITGGNIIIGTNAICRSLTISGGATVVVKSPFKLTLTH